MMIIGCDSHTRYQQVAMGAGCDPSGVVPFGTARLMGSLVPQVRVRFLDANLGSPYSKTK
jgi:hypothetical protein